jgi:hypothetical protein
MIQWESLARLFRDNSKVYKRPILSPEQVDAPDEPNPIPEGKAYCRLWLAEMRLARGVDWFKDRYPVIYAATQYDYGGKLVTVPYVNRLEFFRDLTGNNLDKVVQGVQPLTPLFPYKRGLVELQAALFSMEASDPIGRFIGAMSRLSSLLAVPQLSTVINIIDPLYKSIEDLFNAGDSRFQLGFQQTFAPVGSGGSALLRPGYFAVILAEEEAFNDSQLAVVNDQLRIREGSMAPLASSRPLKGFDYMLFRLETQSAQDWEALTDIKELVKKAQDAIIGGENEAAKQLIQAIRVAVFRSPDVVKADREGMIARIEAELRQLGLQGSRGTGPQRSLYSIMQRPLSQLDDTTRKELAELEKVFA